VKATLTSKGQITVPAAIRERLSLKSGQVLEFDEKAPFLKAYRVIDEKEARKALGCAKKALAGKTVEQWMEWLRGPVELPRNASRR
jgi:AbrB family looped-hinge helix DNA binding protein